MTDKTIIKNAHCKFFEGQTGLCNAKEFTKCNPVNCKLYTIDELSTILELQDKLARKEQECEELKKEINGYKIISEQIKQEVQEDVTCESRECGCDSYEECIECLKNTILNIIDEGNDFVQGRVICKECGKYKKALEEIESLCKNEACAPCKELEENDHCDECHGKIILDIINKAKEQ